MYEIEYFAETEVFKVQKYEASDCNIGRVIDFMYHSISVDGVSVFFVAWEKGTVKVDNNKFTDLVK